MTTDQDSPGLAPLAAQAAADLEWSALLNVLAEGCAGEVAAERMRQLQPASTLAEARALVHASAAALDAQTLGFPVPSRDVQAVDALLEHVERGGGASGEELHALCAILDAAKELRLYGRERREDVPALAELLTTDPALDALLSSIQRAIDASGYVKDEASKALARARRAIHRTRSALLDRIEQLTKKHGDVLRDGSYVERDGRYGLPVRADAHRKVDGIVLGSSSTGATLYVEPPAVTQLGNQLRIAEGDVEREVARVLAELSDAVRKHIDEVRRAYEVALHADHLSALSRWAQRTRSRVLPVEDEPVLQLEGMRHPLLVAQGIAVVKNDLILRSGSALVISGPNAGGKTVALKCYGLAAWMARAGIPIPCGEGSRIGWLAQVLTDVGDNQSIAQSLSTFSAHVASLVRMLEAADERTLVVLDEIAGGTDPEEGSALAAAVLEGLVGRGAAVVTTTHYEKLKELAAEDERFDNASVGFDFDAMAPTFQLTMGVPGASSALAVAQRFGMPAGTLERAKTHLSKAAIDREKLLADLQREQTVAAAARQAAAEDAREVATLRQELTEQRGIVREKERQKLEREKATLMAAIRGARAKLRDLDGAIAKGGRARGERLVDEAASVVALGSAVDQATKKKRVAGGIDPAALSPGDLVHVRHLGADAEVVEGPHDGAVKVRAGVFTLRVPFAELSAPAGKKKKAAAPAPKPKKKKKRRRADPEEEQARRPPMRTSDNTCDLRGQRVDEALEEVDRFVDSFLSGGVDDAGFVLHGHGTGALKKAVRDHLALHGRIAEARAASQQEGGDAFTVFWVRD